MGCFAFWNRGAKQQLLWYHIKSNDQSHGMIHSMALSFK